MWNNIIPPPLTIVGWLHSSLLLLLRLYSGLFWRRLWIPAEAAYCSSSLKRLVKCSYTHKNTNGWTLMRHSLKHLIWCDSAPKLIQSQFCLLQRESGKLTAWWMRKMSGLDRKNAPDSLWTERPQFVSGEFPSTHPGRVMIDCPLSDIDFLGYNRTSD